MASREHDPLDGEIRLDEEVHDPDRADRHEGQHGDPDDLGSDPRAQVAQPRQPGGQRQLEEAAVGVHGDTGPKEDGHDRRGERPQEPEDVRVEEGAGIVETTLDAEGCHQLGRVDLLEHLGELRGVLDDDRIEGGDAAGVQGAEQADPQDERALAPELESEGGQHGWDSSVRPAATGCRSTGSPMPLVSARSTPLPSAEPSAPFPSW